MKITYELCKTRCAYYDDINRNRRSPVMTSCKPIYHVIIDDRAINYHGQDTIKLFKEIDRLLKKSK